MGFTPDNNWRSYYGDNPDVSGFENPEFPKDWDDIMKFSACTNVIVNAKTVAAGRENCVDAMDGKNYTWNKCLMKDGAGVSSFTIKGGIDGWNILNTTIGHGKETDIELGQFDNKWYIGRKPTRNGVIDNCKSIDGKQIIVTCWDADTPKVIASNVKIKRIPKFIWFPYFCFRYVCTHWL